MVLWHVGENEPAVTICSPDDSEIDYVASIGTPALSHLNMEKDIPVSVRIASHCCITCTRGSIKYLNNSALLNTII